LKKNYIKHESIFRLLFISVLGIVFTQIGCSESIVDPIYGTATGKIVLKNEMGGTEIPIPGIMVCLINTDFILDSLNYENNKAAILDTAITDAKGIYTFSNIKNGNYAATPIPGNSGYKFFHNTSTDSYLFSINEGKKRYSISFFSNDPTIFDAGNITIRIIWKDVPIFPDGDDYPHFGIISRRVQRYGSVSTYTNLNNSIFTYSRTLSPMDYQFSHGYSAEFYTLTNIFEFKFIHYSDGSSGNIMESMSYKLSYDLGSVPSIVTLEIDWPQKRVTIL
jgi:hypothetical protein